MGVQNLLGTLNVISQTSELI